MRKPTYIMDEKNIFYCFPNAPFFRQARKVLEERVRQDDKWGVQDHDDKRWLAILAEEFGESARAILERDGKALDEELVHVAAVAFAWLESRERRQT